VRLWRSRVQPADSPIDRSTAPALAAEKICGLALQHSLPTVGYLDRFFSDVGCLTAYGQNTSEAYRGAAAFVDKIIEGAKPAELPVEQPTKFERVINIKTAKALGLTIPQSLLLRAVQIIQ